MIPQPYLIDWRRQAPWAEMHQVEQDLVLTRALIELYSDPVLTDAFAFRGGTAMQKLFYDPPIRYSEDIDLVQIRQEVAGPAIDAIRGHLDPWLGNPRRERKEGRVVLYYRFESEAPPVRPMRLKIEINIAEHFTVLPPIRKTLTASNGWFSGEAQLLTYEREELLGTKLRALFQRKKGRDLLDLAMALELFPDIDTKKLVECFTRYMAFEGHNVSRAQFEANLAEKLADEFFTADVAPLLATGAPTFDTQAAGARIVKDILALLTGDPWKGPGGTKAKKGR